MPNNADATAVTTMFGTSQKTSSMAIASPRYRSMARKPPSRDVTKPSTRRPTVMPPQNPVAVALPANGEDLRILVMKTTIQPPMETSVPTYKKMKREKNQVNLFFSASLVRPEVAFSPAFWCGFSLRYSAPVCVQNVVVLAPSSSAETLTCKHRSQIRIRRESPEIESPTMI